MLLCIKIILKLMLLFFNNTMISLAQGDVNARTSGDCSLVQKLQNSSSPFNGNICVHQGWKKILFFKEKQQHYIINSHLKIHIVCLCTIVKKNV